MNMHYVKGQIVGYVPIAIDAEAISAPCEPRRWYLLQTHPNAEAKVMRVLYRENISYYFPTVQETKRVTRRRFGYDSEVRRTVQAPLFAGIIFVPDFAVDQVLEVHERMAGIDGVAGWMRFGDWVAYLSPKLINDVRTIERIGNIAPSRRKRLFDLGETVRIVDGPFRCFNGVVDRLDSKGRLTILINLFGRLSTVLMTEDQVDKI